ncbi:tetratricopeptide repeat protein [Yeosuana sp. MJ-SS3]|uniref:Tetratricopeptide repeat protein n=1 Tax=Gilvirhabdus luticola TaxID=3079858 RepID=A0ABU3U312_9FLAO|nr:tetratricopeptide repeat protein [Yeosuana sp. MJ-SS3]MDU8884788.1 tetratricopeptide repeat protein [Yeosuana sp. MJ-SS3]
MKNLVFLLLTLTTFSLFSQEKDKEEQLALKKANDFVYEGNEKLNDDEFISAEMEYRKAISEQNNNVAGAYNLGNAYYAKGNYNEALYRHEQAAQNATDKSEKHKAYHNIGNILMQNKKCKEAVEAFKSALRNDPTDNETRYNLALAKECAEQQKDENQDDQNQDSQDQDQNKENQDQKDNQDENKDNKDNQDQENQDQDKKEGDDKKDEDGKPKDEKNEEGKKDQEKKEQQQPKQQPGQMSPQQIKNLLEAMNNQEQKVQEKMNAEKVKGVKLETDKDW